MKKAVLSMFIFAGMSLAAQEKKDIELTTNVSEATVFIKGAQVVRKTMANLPAGKSTVKFTGLSPYIDAKSVQVKVDGEVMVLSVNHQINYNDSVKQSEENKKQAEQLNRLDEKIQFERTTKEIIEEELAFLHDNKKIGGTDGIDFNNLKATSAFYGERIAAIKIRGIETDRKIKALLEERRSMERNLAVSGTVTPEPTGEVVLTAEAKTALNVPVELSYYVNNASWYPSYDIRARSIAEPVELVYKANIMQNTKEVWKNVKLKVSSLNPNLGNVAPELKPYLLNYHTRPPRYDVTDPSNQVRGKVTDASGEALPGASVTVRGTTIGVNCDLDGNFSLSIPSGGGELQIAYLGFKTKSLPISDSYMHVVLEEEQMMLEEVVVVAAGTKMKKSESRFVAESVSKESKEIPLPVVRVENAISAEFEIKTPYTVLSENKTTTAELERYSIPAEYEYYCVPKADKDAFLLANISGWEQYSLLEGEANIFFENTFTGKTILDVRYVGDTLSISLGRDKNVSIQREKVKEYTSRKFLGNKTETTRDWKITLKNNKRQPVSISLFDQIPVSTTQEIEVTPEILSGGTLNRENGEVKWKVTLSPSQKSEIELKYKVKYPKEKTLTVE